MQQACIYIVDDDESNLKVLGYILEDAGYKVTRLSSGRSAIDHIDKQRPDLVLSDIKMPKMDGLSLLKEIKRRDATIPVVMLTAFGSVETGQRGFCITHQEQFLDPYTAGGKSFGILIEEERTSLSTSSFSSTLVRCFEHVGTLI